ncbi:carbohydrate-binding module family 20 domain-containing protein [Actinotalea sp. C106]|uniref:carbohydrate-binding module family 20 domain-containing protein n=1 Tax=Actinotalea sp. C106 TaxID=2908644 RepID=UPI0020294D79|nr:carbohydrate-binding module family 20 domain-containing protein [Actinotalea sp. C106]
MGDYSTRRLGALHRRTTTALLAAAALTLGLVTGPTAPPAAAAPDGPHQVTAVLFQWPWTSIARECTTTLGPAGYGYVQTSPPQEHVQGPEWWTSYQPVSYRLESKLGTRAEYASMVATCRDAGVEVIADVVINHMSGKSEGGIGFAGSPFEHYSYPGIYQPQDFNDCRREIRDYTDAWEVQHCDLVGLADLRTGSTYVRDRIAAYLEDLLSLGVRGFRIDAAKHMPVEDVEAILTGLDDQSVYVVQEVIGAAGEPIRDTDYLHLGDVHEFDYGRELKRVFQDGDLAWLRTFGEQWDGLMPADRAGVFVDNHDTERNGETLAQTDGSAYTLANVFMLAWPYGSPAVHSGYGFTDYDAGPPQASDGTVSNPTCYSDGWRCQHDWAEIRGMVGFRNAVGDAGVAHWWDDGGDRIAFGRGDRGHVVINHAAGTLTRTVQTSLPEGTYCDVTRGGPTASGCSGPEVQVGADGRFAAAVPAGTAVALHVGALSGAGQGPGAGDPGDATLGFAVTAPTTWGQEIRVVGDHPALGSWDPAAAVALSAEDHPVWRGEVALPPGTRVEYKYVRVQGTQVSWEGGGNRVATVPGSGSLTLQDAWR